MYEPPVRPASSDRYKRRVTPIAATIAERSGESPAADSAARIEGGASPSSRIRTQFEFPLLPLKLGYRLVRYAHDIFYFSPDKRI